MEKLRKKRIQDVQNKQFTFDYDGNVIFNQTKNDFQKKKIINELE